MTKTQIILAHPVRTPISTYNGALKTTPVAALGAIAVRETLRRAGLDPEQVDTVVLGNVIQAGNRMNPARQVSIGGGVPVAVPALTVNRVSLAATTAHQKQRYTVGKVAWQISLLRRLMPATMFDKALRQQFRLPS